GCFACLEFSTPQAKILGTLYNLYLKIAIPFWGWVFTRKKEDFEYLAHSIKAFPNQEDFSAMLREAGFRRVLYRNKTGGIAAIHTGKK
ncbi:MAG: class I SAM-dependent methyltransferase, partial [Eggerthellaceae bacterium]|nr:class I SAM-dependent methyltransferase [Eggerthellaceae bacterium]